MLSLSGWKKHNSVQFGEARNLLWLVFFFFKLLNWTFKLSETFSSPCIINFYKTCLRETVDIIHNQGWTTNNNFCPLRSYITTMDGWMDDRTDGRKQFSKLPSFLYTSRKGKQSLLRYILDFSLLSRLQQRCNLSACNQFQHVLLMKTAAI